MKRIIPASPDYLSFLQDAESIDDLGEWLGGGLVTATHLFKLNSEDEGVTLTATDTTRFIAPNLAAASGDIFKFLRTSDNQFLCHRSDEDAR